MQYRFGPFHFDPADRRLTRDGAPVDLSSRYLDVLELMLRERGALVTKDRFMDEVWNGVPVTDEALTQAVRSLRKALNDDAANPRFIETVPKHGYRFVGSLEGQQMAKKPLSGILQTGLAGAAGGAVAGVLGGLGYALLGSGALLVLVVLTGLLGAVGGCGIGLGIGVARVLAQPSRLTDLIGGAVGGLIVGALARLLGIDAFMVLLGEAPMEMTGASEGLLLGAAVGLVVGRTPTTRRTTALLGVGAGLFAGVLIALAGGRLMAGSLALLGETFSMPFTFPGGLWLWLGITAIEAAIFVALTSITLSSVEKRPPQA